MTYTSSAFEDSGPLHAGGADGTALLNQISWGAIFAGAVIALTVQFSLNLLGVGVGASVIDPGTADNPGAAAFSIAGGAWWVASALIGAFIGGYVASRLSGRPVKAVGGYHGVTAWAVTTLFVLYLLTTSAGALIGGAFNGITGALGGVGGAVTSAAQIAAPTVATMNPLQQIEQQVRTAGEGQDPAALRAGASAAVQAVLTGDPAKADEARAHAADALARAQNISADDARKQVADYEASYRATVEQAKQKAEAAAVTTTKVVSRGALIGFFALILGALAGWAGGRAGTARASRRV